jgi:Fic family protein
MQRDAPPIGFRDVEASLEIPDKAMRTLMEGHRPWRKVVYAAPDLGVDPKVAWQAIKLRRQALWQALPVRRREGGLFGICVTPALTRPLYLIDRASGDDLLRPKGEPIVASPLRKRLSALFSRGELVPDRLRVETAMGEAAESSIMEGASATRAQAVEMLRTGRPPATKGERMILNNYEAMRLVKRSLDSPLSHEFLLEMQALITETTLDTPNAAGRFRRGDEQVRVVDTRDDSTVFTPPPAEDVVPLLKEVCDFANSPSTAPPFLHPIIKACILHFLIGYVHPFVDGNGRTARAIFYWHALRHGYTIFEYLAISEIIRQGFSRYPQAYIDSETDDGDLTYFVVYHLDVIEQSLSRLAAHLEHEEERISRSERLLRISKDLNLRQRLILEHALRHPTTQYTVKSHTNSNGITVNTARTDLEDLVRRRLMVTSKRAREVIYHVAPGLAARLAKK